MKIKELTEGILSDIYGKYNAAKSAPTVDANAEPTYDTQKGFKGLDLDTYLQARNLAKEYDKKELIKKAVADAEHERLKQQLAISIDPAKRQELVKKLIATNALKAEPVKPSAPAPATPAPATPAPATPADGGRMPLYTVTVPGGEKVTKYSDGVWVDDNDEYIGNPADIAQLERLATAQKYSASASIPKSQMPAPTWLATKAAEKQARQSARPGQLGADNEAP